MRRLKSVISVIVISVSLLMLVLSLAGIIWGWNATAQLSTGIVNMLTEVEMRLQEVDQSLGLVDSALTQTREGIAEVDENVKAMGTDAEENRRLMTVISDTVGAKVVPLVTKASTAINTFQQTITVLDSTIATLNTLPFISVPAPELSTLRQIADELAALQTAVNEFQTTLSERRSELIEGAVSILSASLNRIDQTLERVETRVTESRQRLEATRTRLAQLKESIPTALNMAALVNTLVLLWVAFGQVGLLIHSWRFLTGKDLLARW
jgi:chromosome segregation ATPase